MDLHVCVCVCRWKVIVRFDDNGGIGVCFVIRCLSFCVFLLAIVFSVLRYTDSDYSFGIFKLFFTLSFHNINILNKYQHER